MGVSPPSVDQMVKTLEKRALILRQPGQARSLKVLISADEIPQWNKLAAAKSLVHAASQPRAVAETPEMQISNLYVLAVFLKSGPISAKFASKMVRRDFEIRGDQTLEQLHLAIFKAFDRYEEHLYEFQFGKRPLDPQGPNYGIRDGYEGEGD